jgi:hypothetical protein
MRHLGEALDKVRKTEYAGLRGGFLLLVVIDTSTAR